MYARSELRIPIPTSTLSKISSQAFLTLTPPLPCAAISSFVFWALDSLPLGFSPLNQQQRREKSPNKLGKDHWIPDMLTLCRVRRGEQKQKKAKIIKVRMGTLLFLFWIVLCCW
jgi:hypothetical protein